ncbi:DUF805 domain-containing protein [Demequina sp.]|uniref:DUF805 domain-containing protein n=1 Tax=Demequina sp. TaxID=2050685 RepID=UPI0025FD2D19|nr:DUF805 domain-containing protein [Demequina sp.]
MFSGYQTALSKYAQFSGRSRRTEYWGFVLINTIIILALELVAILAGRDADGAFTVVGWIFIAAIVVYSLFVLIPAIALSWRRYQDIGWAGAVSIVGWIIPLLTFIVAFIPGNPGANQYGPDPKA